MVKVILPPPHTCTHTHTAPGDYTATIVMITFAPEEDTMTVTVNIVNDDIVEYNEMFFGRLSATDSLVQVTDGEATITIVDEVDSK